VSLRFTASKLHCETSGLPLPDSEVTILSPFSKAARKTRATSFLLTSAHASFAQAGTANASDNALAAAAKRNDTIRTALKLLNKTLKQIGVRRNRISFRLLK